MSKMKKYLVYYSEHSVFEKVFKAKSPDEALEKAREDLEDSGWDTKSWKVGNGEGGTFDVEEA